MATRRGLIDAHVGAQLPSTVLVAEFQVAAGSAAIRFENPSVVSPRSPFSPVPMYWPIAVSLPLHPEMFSAYGLPPARSSGSRNPGEMGDDPAGFSNESVSPSPNWFIAPTDTNPVPGSEAFGGT